MAQDFWMGVEPVAEDWEVLVAEVWEALVAVNREALVAVY
jgi:hypothetical protein